MLCKSIEDEIKALEMSCLEALETLNPVSQESIMFGLLFCLPQQIVLNAPYELLVGKYNM